MIQLSSGRFWHALRLGQVSVRDGLGREVKDSISCHAWRRRNSSHIAEYKVDEAVQPDAISTVLLCSKVLIDGRLSDEV